MFFGPDGKQLWDRNEIVKKKELQKMMEDNIGHNRLQEYVHVFDRILLYTLAVNTMPSEFINNTIKIWDEAIKKSINLDATARTEILESTPLGRVIKLREEEDGETVRLRNLEQWKAAKDIIMSNLNREDEETSDTEF